MHCISYYLYKYIFTYGFGSQNSIWNRLLGGNGTLLRILETVCIELLRILTISSHLNFPNMEDGCLKIGLWFWNWSAWNISIFIISKCYKKVRGIYFIWYIFIATSNTWHFIILNIDWWPSFVLLYVVSNSNFPDSLSNKLVYSKCDTIC